MATDVERLRAVYELDDKQAIAGFRRVAQESNKANTTIRRGMARSETATGKLGRSVGGLGRVMSNSRAQVQNVSFQLGDFATQVGAGTSASVALGQQLPQLLGGFGALGAALGAIVAIGVPLAASFITMGDDADALKKQLEGLQSAVDDYKAAVDAANAPTADLAEKYGVARDQAQGLLKMMALIAKADAMKQVAESGDKVIAVFSDVQKQLDYMDEVLSKNKLGDDAVFEPVARSLERQFGLTVKQARELVGLMKEYRQASSFEEQASAVQRLAEFLGQTADASGNFNDNLVEGVRAAGLAALASIRLGKTVTDASDSAKDLADSIGAISFSSAISGANVLAGQIGGMIGQAQNLLSVIGQARMGNMRAEDRQKLAEAERDMLKAGKGRVEIEGQLARLRKGQELDRAGVTLPTAIYGKLIEDAGKVAEKTAAANEEIAKLKKNASTSGGGASKGGARSKDEKSIFDRTDRQLESLKRQVEMVGKTRAEIVGLTTKYQLLDAAKAKGIPITDALIQRIDAESAAMAHHADQLETARDRTEALNELQKQWEDSIVDAAMGGKDAMEQFLNTLKRAALQYAFFGKGPLADIFGGSGTGILSGLGKLIGFNANGTDNWRGGLSVVGERGPELVNLPRGSQVFSNSKSRDMLRGGAPQAIAVHVTASFDETGNLYVKDVAQQAAGSAVGAYDKQMPARVQQINAKPWKR